MREFDNSFDSLKGYVPWEPVIPVIVQVEDPEGAPVTVGLPYVFAKSARAVRITGIIVASKAAHDVWLGTKMEERKLQLSNLRRLIFDPPLQRFKCEECSLEWDAWIAEDGSLEDPWACACTNSRCANHGGPAVILGPREGY